MLLKNKKFYVLITLVCIVLVYIVFNYKKKIDKQEQLVEQQIKTKKIFAPIFKIFDDNITYNEKIDTLYDIDKTIRVIHEIDLAITKSNNLEDYLLEISKQDYRNVAPEVLKARKKLLTIIMEIYSKQTQLKNQPNYWDLIQKYTLAVGTGINPDGLTSPLPISGIKYDPELTKKTYEEYLESQKISAEIKDEIQSLKNKLLAQLYDYSSTYYKYYEEWDRICINRDKAYLASKNMQWDIVEKEASIAIAKAPFDKEAHILKGLAKVANLSYVSNTINIENNTSNNDIISYLDSFIDKNPSYSAPALLLKGVYYQKKGDLKLSKIFFEESAAYYPKQADKLQNYFDPYKMRTYLRKSKEGNSITEYYKNTMLGGGFFTPDLQLAKLYYNSNNNIQGKNKVLDHFQRRRNQSQWDYIISDIKFCEQAFGNEFLKILPEQNFLTLEVKPELWGDKISLNIQNNSDKRLNNASLILCIQFTEMMRDDYVAIKIDNTIPAILPHQKNDFGSQLIAQEIFGKNKGPEDIVSVRAIVISDESVNWVDTDEFRFEKLKKDKEELFKLHANSTSSIEKEIGIDKSYIKKLLLEKAKLYIKNSKISLNDEVVISLPEKLSLISPIFDLVNDKNKKFSSSSNSLTSSGINLIFKVNKFSNVHNEYTSKIYTKIGDIDIIWNKDKNGNFKIKNIITN